MTFLIRMLFHYLPKSPVRAPANTMFSYNVSTGDARVVTGDDNCYFEETVCLPLSCEIDVIWDRPTW